MARRRMACSTSQKSCAPLDYPAEEQCHHVKTVCPQSETLLDITYPDTYFCASPAARPAAFAGLVVWLIFLFSFIGIAASDFFIPNLATLAEVFGLDDNIAGVTFLAFGNGSPDLFSTLSAMRAGSGSLAIGELIGAATFIVSVVAGSMCIIQSFHVNPVPFLRDVGFFSFAMALLFWILYDGHIHAWEAGLLAALYVCYVLVVIGSTWWDKRRERKRKSLEDARRLFQREPLPDMPSIYVDDEPYRDFADDEEHTPSLLGAPVESPRQRAHSMPGRIDTNVSHYANGRGNGNGNGHVSLEASMNGHTRPNLERASSTVHLHHRPSHQRLQSFSLIGALEFRNVINSLQKESSASVLNAFDNPASPSYAGGHYNVRSRRSSRDSTNIGWDDDVELDRPRSTSPHGHSSHHSQLSPGLLTPDASITLPLHHSAPLPLHHHSQLHVGEFTDTPPHTHTPPSPIPEVASSREVTPTPDIPELYIQPSSPPAASEAGLTKPTGWRTRARIGFKRARSIAHVLFPTLVDLRQKQWTGIAASVLAAPAVFLLTVTLPVVVTERADEDVRGEESKPDFSALDSRSGEFGEAANGSAQRQRAQSRVREGRLIDLDHPHPNYHTYTTTSPPAHPPHHLHRHHARSISHSSFISYHSASSASEEEARLEQLIDTAEDEVLHHHGAHHGVQFNKYLTASQLILGPAFCIAVCFIGMPRYLPWLLLAAFVAGASGAVLVLVFAKQGKRASPLARLMLCLMGFVVAMVWIMAIADEVVQVLNTFGLVFGLSDAIIGLTIFAVGNSLADFVANVTVAQFAPIMGFSACFGGPMLNILLGIGLSGSFVINGQLGGEPYPVEFGSTLLVSCVGLLALLVSTLIYVPWNGFHLTRRWGIFLICSYLVIMAANVLVEIFV